MDLTNRLLIMLQHDYNDGGNDDDDDDERNTGNKQQTNLNAN